MDAGIVWSIHGNFTETRVHSILGIKSKLICFVSLLLNAVYDSRSSSNDTYNEQKYHNGGVLFLLIGRIFWDVVFWNGVVDDSIPANILFGASFPEQFVNASGNTHLNITFSLLRWSSIIDNIVIFHDNISEVPSVLLNLLAGENSEVALVRCPAQVVAWDH